MMWFKSKPKVKDPTTEAFIAVLGPFIIGGLIVGGVLVGAVGLITVMVLKAAGVF